MTLGANRDLRNRLRTAQGQLDAVLRMVEADAYCPDVMKQLSAVQGLLEGSSRIVLRNHLETCVAKAMVLASAFLSTLQTVIRFPFQWLR